MEISGFTLLEVPEPCDMSARPNGLLQKLFSVQFTHQNGPAHRCEDQKMTLCAS